MSDIRYLGMRLKVVLVVLVIVAVRIVLINWSGILVFMLLSAIDIPMDVFVCGVWSMSM